jgi:hypothetical protein
MDAQQAVRLIEEIELRLAFAGAGEGGGGPASWPDGTCDGPLDAAVRTSADALAGARRRRRRA